MAGETEHRVRRRGTQPKRAAVGLLAVGLVALAAADTVAAAPRHGDGQTTHRKAGRGELLSCERVASRVPRGDRPPWLGARRWSPARRPLVKGAVRWPEASFQMQRAADGSASLRSTGLPVGGVTGEFPPAPADDAAPYVASAIRLHHIEGTLPAPRARRRLGCVRLGKPIGIALDGVPFLAPADGSGRDLAAREITDRCGGSVSSLGIYGYRRLPSCLPGVSAGSRGQVIGWALDGFPITTATGRARRLDRCHGRRGPIELDGAVVRAYHYEATESFPYLVGCFRGKPASWSVAGKATSAAVNVRVNPDLFPVFGEMVSDYVTHCGDGTVTVTVTGGLGASTSVDGGPAQGGDFTADVALNVGQRFEIATRRAGVTRTHHVRCLPDEFPVWAYERAREPNNSFYMIDPNLLTPHKFVIVFDDHGVPVWWYETPAFPLDPKTLSDGSLAWAISDLSGYEIRSVDGRLLRKVSVPVVRTDIHDMEEVGNGNMLLLSYTERSERVDLTAYGGPADARVADAIVHEIDPKGNEVWTWNSKDHIALEETGRWWPEVLARGQAYDIAHINAVEMDGNAMLISLRHTDAVYKIDRATGDVIWKLGGTATPESLTVLNDPYADYPLGGQHDARVQPDGTVTIYDNATNLTNGDFHPPRAVRYAIDEAAGTATLVESISDPAAPTSFCCGSARRSPSGAWVMNWGGDRPVSEFDRKHRLTFRMDFPHAFAYRAFPVPEGQLTREQLRAGMDAMFPRGG
jgi:hypothetical protein